MDGYLECSFIECMAVKRSLQTQKEREVIQVRFEHIARLLVQGVVTGLLIGCIDSLSKHAKAQVRKLEKRRMPPNRFDFNLN